MQLFFVWQCFTSTPVDMLNKQQFGSVLLMFDVFQLGVITL